MATPAGVPGCTKLLSVFAVHAFLSTFGLLGFGFTIHCLLTTHTCKHHPSFYCGRPFSGQPFFGTVFSVLAAWGFSEPVIPFEA